MSDCLRQTDNENVYIHAAACKSNCKPVACPQFELCRTWIPQDILECNGGLCMNCAVHKHARGEIKIVEVDDEEPCSCCHEPMTKAIRYMFKGNHIEFTCSFCLDCYYQECYSADGLDRPKPTVLQVFEENTSEAQDILRAEAETSDEE